MSWWASPRLQVRPAPANEVTKTNTPVNFFEPFFTLTDGLSESALNGPDGLHRPRVWQPWSKCLHTQLALIWSQEPHALHLCLDKMEKFVTPPQRNLLCSSTKTLEASEMHLSVNVSVNRSKWTFLPCRTTTSVRSFETGGSITGKLANYFNVEPCSYTFLTSFISCSQLL